MATYVNICSSQSDSELTQAVCLVSFNAHSAGQADVFLMLQCKHILRRSASVLYVYEIQPAPALSLAPPLNLGDSPGERSSSTSIHHAARWRLTRGTRSGLRDVLLTLYRQAAARSAGTATAAFKETH